jgi:hypothetical protein
MSGLPTIVGSLSPESAVECPLCGTIVDRLLLADLCLTLHSEVRTASIRLPVWVVCTSSPSVIVNPSPPRYPQRIGE